jgi:hypothetical protein
LNAFAGNVYAPNANVLVGGVGRVLGSLFGKNITAAGFLDVGFDESVSDGQVECPPPGDGDEPDDGTPDDGTPDDDSPGGDTPSDDSPGDDTPDDDDTPGGGPDAPPPCDPGDAPTLY